MPQPRLPDDLFEHDEETFSLITEWLSWQRMAADLQPFAQPHGLDCDVVVRRTGSGCDWT